MLMVFGISLQTFMVIANYNPQSALEFGYTSVSDFYKTSVCKIIIYYPNPGLKLA